MGEIPNLIKDYFISHEAGLEEIVNVTINKKHLPDYQSIGDAFKFNLCKSR